MTTTTFDPGGPLPHGVTVLEASAGTGKTYAIAALTTRFLAQGAARVDDLLLVTFSRAATAELRLRVRDRVRDSAAALAGAARGVRPTDPVDRALAEGLDEAELRARAARLAQAFADFDQATIMTTHEFCHGMLRGLGVLAPQTPQSRLVEDLTPLADEVAADLYLARFADEPGDPPFRFADPNARGGGRGSEPGARSLARDAVRHTGELAGADASGAAGARVAFAADVRAEVERRKQRRRMYSFDDQLQRLADALADPVSGPQACAKLARRFPVVLVDEFQDTDPVQWDILSRAFSRGSTVVLIGDPKQAIYAFRGADVHTYRAAIGTADQSTTLQVNHRSDAPVVAALDTLFRGLRLGEGIEAPPVRAAHGARLVAAAGSAWVQGLQLRVIEATDELRPWAATEHITADLLGVVADLLGPQPPLRRPDGPLRPADVAILVRTNRRGQALADELRRVGIPATFSGTTSVFASPAAEDWLTLLRALDQTRRPYAERALLTDFVGATVPALALADEARRDAWLLQLHRWSRVLARAGVPALLAAFDHDTQFTARLLQRPDGERLVTDHRHLAELLHEQAQAAGGAHARDLARWLARETADVGEAGERARRLETDADAVSIMTIHRAKGLQWPVVLLPEACLGGRPPLNTGQTLVVPTREGRLVDVGGASAPGRENRWEQAQREDADEALRTLYVGLTRAQSHIVTWWAPHTEIDRSPLDRILRAPRGGMAPAPGDPRDLVWPDNSGIATLAAGADADARPTPATATRATATPATPAPAPAPADLTARPWNRAIDHEWRRTSYSGLTAATHDAPSADETLTGETLADETLADEPADPLEVTPDPAWVAPSPLADLPGGTSFGTLVHAVYESTDPSGPEWRAALAASVADALRRWPLRGLGADAVTAALEPTFTTPLGPLAPGATMRSFGPADRLSELDFEFALAHPRATVADIARLCAEYLSPDDPLAAYPELLAAPGMAAQRLHGYLTGSIDAVWRLDGNCAGSGYLIVDYKTNRLAAPDEPLTVGHYAPDALAAAMMASHYPLQALLYSVALHRFLRLRLAGYDPSRHLAGVAYLFVRGMAGPQTPLVGPHPLGVFSWRPPAELVASVSELLAGGDR